MAFELTILGTSSMVPTKDRNVQGMYLEYKGEGILFDCGEGTQRQMNIAGINRHKVKKVLITHWHGDHVSGLVGLIQTIGNTENPGKLTIYGPEGSKKFVDNLLNSCIFDLRIEIEVKEFNPKGKEVIEETNDYYIEVVALQHGVPCLGYSFVEKDSRSMNVKKLEEHSVKGADIGKLQRGKTVSVKGEKITPDMVSKIKKGKKISVILDTVFNENCSLIAEDSDYLICEATYESSKMEKAEEYNHMTAEQAAFLANNANVKKLILTHFSQRYKSVNELEKEAKEIFPDTIMAYDFLKIKI